MKPVLIRAIMVVALMTGAAEARDVFSGLGAGNASCGAWTKARRDGAAENREQWVPGFLTGVGYGSMSVSGPDPLAFTDGEGVWA
jgi:hypothetical protein